jgi:hypothetical protein
LLLGTSKIVLVDGFRIVRSHRRKVKLLVEGGRTGSLGSFTFLGLSRKRHELFEKFVEKVGFAYASLLRRSL